MTIKQRTNAKWLGFAAISAIFLTHCIVAHAQTANDALTVVRPTDNGFDELMRAGNATLEDDTTTDRKVIADADSGMATLTQRRAAVNDPAFRAALAEMREALDDPIVSPSFAKAEDTYQFSSPARRIARFLNIEEQVLLAEGKTQAALDAFADGLRISVLAKRWGIMGVITGETVEVVTMRPILRHLDQLSARDCDTLLARLRSELRTPDPAVEGIRAQKGLAHFEIDSAIQEMTVTNGQVNAAGQPAYDPFGKLTDAERQEIVQMRADDPQGTDALQKAARERLETQYELTAQQLTAYPEAVQTPELLSVTTQFASNALADRLVQAISLVGDTYGYDSAIVVVQKAASSRTRLQLLAVHAAILRWRWEHNVLPPDLSALKIGALIDDPFLGNGQPFPYTRLDDTHYTLASAGPPQRDDAGNLLPGGKRDAFTLETPGP